MSTNKTPNYNLHSWLPQDEFHVSEINENFTKLDAALGSEAAALAASIDQLDSETLRLCAGSYAGRVSKTSDSTATFEVNLGGKPRVVFVGTKSGYNPYDSGSYAGFATQTYPLRGLTLTETGFIAGTKDPRLNEYGVAYVYLALM